MSSAGTLNEKGLFIGVDMFGKNDNAPLDELGAWHKAVVSETSRIPVVVAHESIHYQQKFLTDDNSTLLERVLIEGGADFIASLIINDDLNPAAYAYGNAHEQELWRK